MWSPEPTYTPARPMCPSEWHHAMPARDGHATLATGEGGTILIRRTGTRSPAFEAIATRPLVDGCEPIPCRFVAFSRGSLAESLDRWAGRGSRWYIAWLERP